MSAPGPAESVSLEVLLEHRDWVRALARTLVADPHAADDVEQETWRMALERPPRHAKSLRAWFGTVVRHAAAASWRSDARRARGESGLPPTHKVPAPDDVVAEAELQTRLARAVLDLDEPYRSTVLRRFVRGESPTEIAARTGVPLDTVKTRLRRALATLRERLSGAHCDDRSAWVLLLAGGARPPDAVPGGTGLAVPSGAVAAAGGGLVAMGLGTKSVAGLVVLAVAGTWFALREDAADGTRGGSADGADAAELVADGGVAVGGRPRAGRPGASKDESAATGAAVAATSFRGRVVEADGGAPIEGARVTLFAHPADAVPGAERVLDPGPSRASTVTSADGSFELSAAGVEKCVLVASAPGRAPASVVGERGSYFHVIQLRAATRHGTVVVATDGTTIAGARVLVFTPGSSPVPTAVATTDAAGRAAVDMVPDVSRVCVAAEGRETTDLWAALPALVNLGRGLDVAGTVVGIDGRPFAGATVNLRQRGLGGVGARTDSEGRFVFHGLPAIGSEELHVRAPGHVQARTTVAMGDVSVRIVLVPWKRVRGRVVDASDRPVASAEVHCTPGPESSGSTSALTDAEGRFEIDAPSAGTYDLWAGKGEIADGRYGFGVPALSGEAAVGAAGRERPAEVVIRVAPPVLSFARIDAFDAEGTRLAIEGLAASGRVADRQDESGRMHLVFDCAPGTRVAGRLSTFGPEGVRQPEFPVELTTGADGDVDVVSVRPPTSPLLRIRLLGADGAELPAGASGTAILWEVGPRGRRCLGSGPVGESPLWRVESSKRYAVEVWVAGRVAPPREFAGADAAEGPIAVRLAPAPRIRGRVLGSEGRPQGSMMLREMGGRGGAQVQPDGEFDIALSRDGDVGIEVLHGLDPWWTGTFRVEAGQVLDVGEIRLPVLDLVEVRGRVLDPSGTPAGGALVSWLRTDGNSFGCHQTDASGGFAMQRPRGERGTVLAQKIGRGAAWQAVEVASTGESVVEVKLLPAGRVRVTFRGDLDALRSIDTVGVRCADGAVVWYPRRDDVETRRIDESVFVLEDLPPGPLTVFGRSEIHRFEGAVTVVAGATTALTIDERE